MTDDARIRALFGDPFQVRSERGYWLARCRQLRAELAWITEGAYAWWRTIDVLKACQRKLLEMRVTK